MSEVRTFTYVPDGPVLDKFFWDRSPVAVIQGPVGSGTSTTCCFKILKIGMEQKPDENNVRKTRWLVVRNTFDQLKQTTLRTWRYWMVEKALGAFGDVKMSNPPEHRIRWAMRDNTMLEIDVIFLSLDQPEDIRKLLSMEYTGVWFNEVQFSDWEVFGTAHSRVGRFPPKLDGGPTWRGVIADMNAPEEGHWVPYLRGDVPLPLEWSDEKRKEYQKPKSWKFFMQPPGLIEVFKSGRMIGYKPNPEAENAKWLDLPYMEMIEGKSKTWIDTYIMNRVGLYRAGKPVFESFVPETHVSKEKLEYQPGWPLIVGLDFARNPAAAICQFIRGQMFVLDEFGQENVSAVTFAPDLREYIAKKFPDAMSADSAGVQFWGDPTGNSMGQGTDQTPFQIFKSHGMAVAPAPGNNNITLRLAAVESLLNKMVHGGPGLMLCKYLRTLKAGMSGAYHYAKVQGQARHQDKPYKDTYSDYCDALQYACLGAGIGTEALTGGKGPKKPTKMKKKKYSLRKR